jgi:beta-ureidopropionase
MKLGGNIMIAPYTACAAQVRWQVIERREQILEEIIPYWERLMYPITWCSMELPLKLVCFPEGCLDGWPEDLLDLPHQTAYDTLAIDVPGPETERIGKNIAKQYGVYVIFTAKAKWPEVIKNRVFNTAIIINPDGEVIHKYAKNIVGTFETSTTPHDVYDAWVEKFGDGLDAFFPVVDTDIGKIGTLICYEGSFPETWRGEAMNGAEIIYRTSYITLGEPDKRYRLQNQANALFNCVYTINPTMGELAHSSVTGYAGKATPYECLGAGISGGDSTIIDYRGQLLSLAGHTGETFIFSPINIEALRDYRARVSVGNWLPHIKSEIFRKIYEEPVYPKNSRMKAPKQREEYTKEYMRVVETLIQRDIFTAPSVRGPSELSLIKVDPAELKPIDYKEYGYE